MRGNVELCDKRLLLSIIFPERGGTSSKSKDYVVMSDLYTGERDSDEDHQEELVHGLPRSDQPARQRTHPQALGGHKVRAVNILTNIWH